MGFVVYKTDFPKVCKPLTRLAEVKTDSLEIFMLCGCQNELCEVIEATYTICSSHNGLSKLLQASFML